MNKLLRFLTFGIGWQVKRGDAVEIARAECLNRGKPWAEPVHVHRSFGDWELWTDTRHRGGNMRIVVDGGTGAVKGLYGPMPR